jgi:REP element-mobilizing transposase RayT
MSKSEYKQYYERHRPHIHPPDATFFITFRLFGSIPKAVIREYLAKKDWLNKELQRIENKTKNEPDKIVETQQQILLDFKRTWFKKFEDILDLAKDGPMWLSIDEVRQIVAKKLQEDDEKKYRLDAFCIMSNHVHVVLKPHISEANLLEIKVENKPKFVSTESTLPQIMQSIKVITARKANLHLNKTGSFWETESYDHYIREEDEFNRIIKYTINNAVKANLVKHWKDWKGTYLADRLKDKF